jgi:hypothetical protein
MLAGLVHSSDVLIWALWSVIPLVLFIRGRYKLGAVATVVVLFMIAVYLPSGAGARERAQRMACLKNQEDIARAIDEAAKAKGSKTGDTVDIKELVGKLSYGTMPTCPAGGTYTITKVGEPPTCSLGNHKPDEH